MAKRRCIERTNRSACCSVQARNSESRPGNSSALRDAEAERKSRIAIGVVREYLHALSRGDIEAVLALNEPEGRQVDVGASGAGMATEQRRRRLESLRSAYEEIEFRMVDSWQTGDRIAFRWRAQGTTLCGTVVELRGLDMFEISERGKVVRHWLDLRPRRYFPEDKACPELARSAARFGWHTPRPSAVRGSGESV